MLATIVTFAIYIVIIAVVFVVLVAILRAAGVVVPDRVIQLLGLLLVLIVILWFITGGVVPIRFGS